MELQNPIYNEEKPKGNPYVVNGITNISHRHKKDSKNGSYNHRI